MRAEKFSEIGLQRIAMKCYVFFTDFQMADKSLAVEFKKPWNLLAEFNSAPLTKIAAGGEIRQKLNWRCLLDKVRTFFDESPVF
jgi:hypothetical protein